MPELHILIFGLIVLGLLTTGYIAWRSNDSF